MSGIVLLLYATGTFVDTAHIGQVFLISQSMAILSGVTLAAAIILYLLTPSRFTLYGSLLAYALLVASIGSLIVLTNGINSPFIALWMGVSIFAGMFGLAGIITMLIIVNGYIIYSFLGHEISRDTIIFSALAGELPIIISYIIWGGREQAEVEKKSDMSNLNRALTQESSKSDAVIKAIGDGVIVVDPTGNMLLVNPAAQQMIGWSGKDAVGLHYESAVKLQDSQGNTIPELENPIARVLNTNQQVRENNITILTKSGRHLSAAFVVTPIGDSGEGAIAVFRDVTKERAEEREQAEFISTASHEMRTPVASIEGYLGLALNPNTAQIDEKARDYINKAHESAQHLGHLFQDLLDITKVDDGRMTNNPRVIDIVAFTREVMDSLRVKAETKGLELIYKPDGSKGTVGTTVIAPILYASIDKDHLREVLSNLIDNAIKYTPHGQVTIDVTGNDERIQVAITDSGIGIAEEDIPHLFQKFYRIDNSDTREIGGTGLGLYLCRRIIETMEGRIWVESEFQKGSTFNVEIPRLARDEATRLIDEERRRQEQEREKAEEEKARGTKNTDIDTPTLDALVHETAAPQTPSPETVQPAAAPQQPAVTQQLPTSAPQQPVATPVVQMTPAPLTVAPAPATPSAVAPPQPAAPTQPRGAVSYEPSRIPVPANNQNRQNIPLSALERDPENFVTKRP